MKKIIRSLCVMIIASLVLSSCLGDNSSSVESYSDTAITAVTLGTLNRYTHAISSNTGNDTIVKTTLAGANYKLTIDQIGCKIFNRDSLPLGTDLKHVTLSTLSTKNSGVALIRSLISDTLFYISSTDSIDFSQPRTIRVMATNGIDYRDYTMTLSASTTTGITFGWERVAVRDDLAGWTDKRLESIGDTVALVDYGTIAVEYPSIPSNQLKLLLRISDDGYLEWSDLSPKGYLPWSKIVDSVQPVRQLLGATDNEIYALGVDGYLKAIDIDDDGISWHDEQLDDSPTLLPSTAIAMASWKYAPTDDTDYVLMVGNSDADATNAVCWRKLSHTVGQDTEGIWVYMPVDGFNRYALPRQEYLSMTYYNNNVLAVGSNMKLYLSRDQGITWKTGTIYDLPKQVGGTRAAIAADERDRLWLVTDSGELWMGTLR